MPMGVPQRVPLAELQVGMRVVPVMRPTGAPLLKNHWLLHAKEQLRSGCLQLLLMIQALRLQQHHLRYHQR